MRKSTELQTAYVHFAHAVGRLLESKGAGHDHGVYMLATPGGPLTLWPVRNWILGRFANPVGGFIVTDGLSQEHSGRWNTNFHDDAEALTNPGLLAGFEFDLDYVLAFEVTAEQREAIEHETVARRLQCEGRLIRPNMEPLPMSTLREFDTGEPLIVITAAATTPSVRFDGTSTPRPIIH